MSWQGTFSHNVLYAVDVLAGTLFWNVDDMTISAMCRMWRLGKLEPFKLYGWQVWLLSKIEPALEYIEPGHCEGARLADLKRAQEAIAKLTPLG